MRPKSPSKLNYRPKNENCLKNENDLKNEDDLKSEDDLKNEDDHKNEDEIKNEDNLKKYIEKNSPPTKKNCPLLEHT